MLRRRGRSFRIEAGNFGVLANSTSVLEAEFLGVKADVGEEDLDKVQPLLGLLHVGHCSHPGPVKERKFFSTKIA
jgi:hypothetical protein